MDETIWTRRREWNSMIETLNMQVQQTQRNKKDGNMASRRQFTPALRRGFIKITPVSSVSLLALLKTVGLHHALKESKHWLMNLHHQPAFRLEKSTKGKFDLPYQRLCESNCVCVPKTITVSSFTHTIRVAWVATRKNSRYSMANSQIVI